MTSNLLHPWIFTRIVLILCSLVLAVIAAVAMASTLARVASSSMGAVASERELKRERSRSLGAAVLDLLVPLQVVGIVCTVISAHQIALSLRGAMCAYAVFHGQGDGAGVTALVFEALTLVTGAACMGVRLVDRAIPGSELSKPLAKLTMLFVVALFADAFAVGRLLLSIDLRVHASCCSSGFSAIESVAQSAASSLTKALISGALIALISAVSFVQAKRAPTRAWAMLAGGVGLLSVAWLWWVITNVSAPYVFEAPTHRCVYCLLRYSEGGWVGMLLWASTVFTAVSASAWVAASWSARGLLASAKHRDPILHALAIAHTRTTVALCSGLVLVALPVLIYRLKTGQFLTL